MQEEAAWAQVSLGGAALREARAELAEARKQWHSLQVEIETLHALVRKNKYLELWFTLLTLLQHHTADRLWKDDNNEKKYCFGVMVQFSN